MDRAPHRMEGVSPDTIPSPADHMDVIQEHLHAHDGVGGFGVDPGEWSVRDDIHRTSP